MSSKHAKRVLPLLAVMAIGLAQGCAEEREPINKVQANALHKSFFLGADIADPSDDPRFYVNGTVLDIGYGSGQDGLLTSYYANELSIIRWEVTEDLLLGRLAYERIEDTDGQGVGETNDGQVIYAFTIQSHFDIRRDYNPSTGEELNVLVENTSDRPWYQREYMRVDWSRNLNTDAYDYDVLATEKLFSGLSWEPIAYYVNDPAHPHAPRFEVDDGYFDITVKAFATPGEVDISHLGWGLSKIPACWLDADFSGGTFPYGNCNPVETTIRLSFWQVPDTDYEAQDWDGFRFQAAGAFTKERFGFARNYGMSDQKWHRFISRYNIWERSHADVECFTPETTPVGQDPKRDLDGNGTADECETAGAGSRCDVFKQKCTIPYAKRNSRPIVWYVTSGSENRFFEPTFWASQDWDAAMRIAIQAARNAECFRTGAATAEGQDCNVAFPVPKEGMTMQTDAVEIIKEVDACMAQKGTWTSNDCANVVDDQLVRRGYQAGTPDYDALRKLGTMDQAVVLCHSPIEAGDHPACAPGKARLPAGLTALACQQAEENEDHATLEQCAQGYTVRIGDVRRHLINLIKPPQQPTFWGFGPTYADPLTGEGISASINVMTNVNDSAAQLTVDITRFIAGELSTADLTDGVYVKDWVKASEIAGSKGVIPPMTRTEYDERIAGMVEGISRDLETGHSHMGGTDAREQPLPTQVQAKLEELQHVRAAADAPTTLTANYLARMRQAQGTETEAQLTGPAMVQYAGATKLPAQAAIEAASPIRGMTNQTMRRELHRLRELGMAERGACMLEADQAAPSPTGMIALGKVLQEKFGNFNPADPVDVKLARAATMEKWLANKMHYAVIAHEMGHTFGLRHNFVSSSSAFNYRPQYWQLRTRNGQVTELCNDLTETADEAANCVGPRYFDQVTPEEEDNFLYTWQHSSVMDYAGDYTQDMIGLGAYDYNAARMFYGETATVYADDDLKAGGPLSGAINETIQDDFGGIIGYSYQSAPRNNQSRNKIHYSQLNTVYKLIQNCQNVDAEQFRPTYWDESKEGAWNPTIDGLLVKVDGQYSRCQQRRVEYVHWDQLSMPTVAGSYRGGPAVDPLGRTRVPYAFATDRWADIGNLSVYRHDNGADPYELFDFFVSEQELHHIFVDYRRDRQAFSVRVASDRFLNRYNTKMRDGAKGVGLQANFIRDLGIKLGLEPSSFFDAVVGYWGWQDNMLAAGMAFDHFARQMQRPNAGPHYDPGGTLNSVLRWDDSEVPAVIVPDGPQGFWAAVGIGGRPVNNDLADGYGEYDAQYTINAGSYYEKLHTTMLLTESVDNFISSSLEDFVDPRYRAVSIADLLPDGYRRYLANNLTGDDWIKGPRVAANGLLPDTQPDMYPSTPIGWTSWWPQTPEVCFPNSGTMICSGYGIDGALLKRNVPAGTRVLDPQVGWEQMKFLIAWTLVYLPENQKTTWMDMMGIWDIGEDSDPGFDNRIELHLPSGDTYVARTYGTEDICFESCKTVQRGIGARILQYANELMQGAYVTNPIVTQNATWYEPVILNGKPIVKYDPTLAWQSALPADCRPDPTPGDSDYSQWTGCECENNAACTRLADYVSVPNFLRSALRDFRMADPSMKGIY
jgi:uncharacterized protein DUF4953